MLLRNVGFRVLVSILLFSTCACNGNNPPMGSKPLTSGILPTSESVTELSPHQVAEAIRNEAQHLSIDFIRTLPMGREIVSEAGVLVKRLSLGELRRAYSLMDNSTAAVEDKLKAVALAHNNPENDAVRETLSLSFRRDLSDHYIASISVEGMGVVGYVYAPVYSVYKGFSLPNTIFIKELVPHSHQQNATQLSSMPIGSLDDQHLKQLYPDASVDEHLYWFWANPGGFKLVRIVKKPDAMFLFSEEDGAWFAVSESTQREGDKGFAYKIGTQKVAISAIGRMP